MTRRQNPEPKPFFWIPLKGEPERQRPVGHHRLHPDRLTGWMELEIEVISDYLYVGSGQFDLRRVNGREVAVYAFTRRGGQLIIPGTSIKGAIRSIVEAISNSCVKVTARKERVPRAHNTRRCTDEALCPACRLFGSTGYRGQVYFSDAEPVGNVQTTVIKIADLWPPRQAKGRKFYENKRFRRLDLTPAKNHRFLEVVAQGTKFRTVMYFENLNDAEMGLLFRAMGLDLHPKDAKKAVFAFPVKLGGAKPRCLGSVRLIPKRLRRLHPGQQLLASLLKSGEAERITPLLVRCLQDNTLLDNEAWEQFKEGSRTRSEFCPQGVY